jgi:hypothetical protein
MKQFEKTVYVSHKYGGNKNNLKEVEEIIKTQQKKHPNYMFISPLHMFSFLYNDMSYEDGLELCLYQLAECDEIWVTGETWYDSTGVIKEIEYANAHKIDVLFVTNAEDNPHKVEGSADYIRGFAKGVKLGKKEWQENTSKKNKVAYINEDDIIRTYISHFPFSFVIKCPFCELEHRITLHDENPARISCTNCHNLFDFSNLTYGDIL